MLLYRFVPGRRLRLLDALAGAVTTAILLLAISFASGRIYANVTRLSVVYGSLTAAFVFLYSVYLYASALLFGGQVAAAWSVPAEPRAATRVIVQIKRAVRGLFMPSGPRARAGRPMTRNARLAVFACGRSGRARCCSRRQLLRRERRRHSRRDIAPVVRLVNQPEQCGPGEPYVPIDVTCSSTTRRSRCAARGRDNLVKVAPSGERPCARALRVSPGLPRQRTRSGLQLPALVAPAHQGPQADRLRPRRDRSRLPRAARAPILDVLRVQRLEQPPRGRLGDDPAELPRVDREPGVERDADRDRLQPARGRREGGVGRPEARARRRHAPGRVSGRRLARELLRLGALPRARPASRASAATTPEAPISWAPRRPDDPQRPGRGARGVPLARVPGPVGRAAAGVLQRPHRAEPEDPVDAADLLVAGVA